jgi:hypothetical protein
VLNASVSTDKFKDDMMCSPVNRIDHFMPFNLSLTSRSLVCSIVSRIEQSLADITLTKPDQGEHLQVDKMLLLLLLLGD